MQKQHLQRSESSRPWTCIKGFGFIVLRKNPLICFPVRGVNNWANSQHNEDKKRKLEEIEQESEARGQAKAEKATEVVIYNLQTKLSSTQFELCEARQENARNMQLIRKLREDTQKEVMGMREVLQAVREKVVN
jgi:hypothetical protein